MSSVTLAVSFDVLLVMVAPVGPAEVAWRAGPVAFEGEQHSVTQ
ncbi:hypothetical protein [Streptomyces sclerotialus]